LLLGLLFYGYATGVFSSRKIEQATYEVLPFRFIAGDMHPDHDTIVHFRRQHLAELKELFVQALLLTQTMGYLQLGTVSLDGSKIHADASKSKAVSYKRLLAIEAYLQAEVAELFAMAEAADRKQWPEEMNLHVGNAKGTAVAKPLQSGRAFRSPSQLDNLFNLDRPLRQP
jgi:hypothetical protein